MAEAAVTSEHNDRGTALVVSAGRQLARLEDVRIDELRASSMIPLSASGASLYAGGHADKFKTSRTAKRDKERSDQCDRIADRNMPREE
jgi:hypothetical protein